MKQIITKQIVFSHSEVQTLLCAVAKVDPMKFELVIQQAEGQSEPGYIIHTQEEEQ